ncbi:MAG TPA: hypothetical protein VFV02_02610 [Acidimicrobiales bacterium]|nr:hypothetical protein [Acidimicrobiales bacterium]
MPSLLTRATRPPPSDAPEICSQIGCIDPDEPEPLSRAERWRLSFAILLACALIAVAERLPNPRPGGSHRCLLSARRSTGLVGIHPDLMAPRLWRELTSTSDPAA